MPRPRPRSRSKPNWGSDARARTVVRLVTVGVGAMNSPRYAPAGLLVVHRSQALRIEPRPVVHTSHPTVGYEIVADGRRGGVGAGVLGVPVLGGGCRPALRRRGGLEPADPLVGGVGTDGAARWGRSPKSLAGVSPPSLPATTVRGYGCMGTCCLASPDDQIAGGRQEVATMITVQCPKCELRFASGSEVVWHLRQDHRRSKGLGLPDRLHQPRRAHRSERERIVGATWLRCW
jgi:hypothetical protein